MIALLAMVCGFLVGAVQGLIGGGGSVLGVPLLVYVVGVRDPHAAIGATAAAVSVAALASLVAYMRSGYVKWRCGAAFTLAGLIGALAGSSLGKNLAGDRLLFLSGVLMIFVAASMLRARRFEGDAAVRLDRDTAPRLAPQLLGLGVVVGFLSGFFGIGGGFLAVPGLLRATDMPLIYAIGTSLMSVAIFGAATAASYAASGLVDWAVTALFMAGGVLGGVLATKAARCIAGRGALLARLFAAIVALVGAFVIFKSRAAFFS